MWEPSLKDSSSLATDEQEGVAFDIVEGEVPRNDVRAVDIKGGEI